MTDTEQILQAIAGLENKFTAQLAETEQRIMEQVQAKQQRQTVRINALDARTAQQSQDIESIKKRLDALTQPDSDALVRRVGSKAILRKEPVYRTFEDEYGISSRKLMRLLDELGLIYSTPRHRTVTAWDEHHKHPFRALAIIVPIK